jgi:hypothetical protein
METKDTTSISQPDGFTIKEYVETERAANPKGKKWLFQLMIVIIVLWEIVKLPYTIGKAIYKYFKKPRV